MHAIGLENARMRRKPAFSPGFTLVELLVVLFIILLLVGLASPMFSQLLKTSRVQQTANVVFTALFRARAEAQRYRSATAVYYGDLSEGMNKKPYAGILPKYGSIEIFTVQNQGGDYVGEDYTPNPLTVGDFYWDDCYPFLVKVRPLTPQALSFPDGVRIISGYFSRWWDGTKYVQELYWPSYDPAMNGNKGEIKRHHTVYTRTGRICGYGTNHNWQYLLIFDAATGEHKIVWCGQWYSNARPLILDFNLNRLKGTDLDNYRKIGPMIDNN